MAYDLNTMQAMAAAAGMSLPDYASSDAGSRALTNLGFQSQGQDPYYTDTSTPITPFGGFTGTTDSLVAPTGPVSYRQDMISPVYGGQQANTNSATPSNGAPLTGSALAQATGGQFGGPMAPPNPVAASGGNLGMGGGMPPPVAAGPSGGGAPALSSYKQNPYLQDMAKGLQTQFNNNLSFNTLPALRGGAVAAGGVGGSRQGIAEGLATAQSNIGADNAIAGLYGQDYGNQMNRNMQQYGLDQNYSLGLGNQALTNQGQQLGFYTNQRQLDQSGAQLGANLYNQGTNGQWNPINNASGVYNNYTGLNNSTTGGTQQGGGAMGAAGGAMGAAQLAKNLGLFGGSGSGSWGFSL